MSMNPPGGFPAPLLAEVAGGSENPHAVQDANVFETDYSFEQIPQRIGNVELHHYWQVFTIGVITGPANAQSVSPGLTVGAFQRIVVEKNPEIWIVSLSSKAGGGSVLLWEGEPGGPYIPLGLGGYAVIPSRGPSITLQATGATANGVVIAMGGFSRTSNPSPMVNVGAF